MTRLTERWTPKEIEAASEITPSDILAAIELIREASPELLQMINAEESE